jgi:hypothetical protein
MERYRRSAVSDLIANTPSFACDILWLKYEDYLLVPGIFLPVDMQMAERDRMTIELLCNPCD